MFPYFEQIFDEYCVLFVKVIIVVAIIQFTIGGILALIGWILERREKTGHANHS